MRGEVVAYRGSSGYLELAIRNGSAAEDWNLGVGAELLSHHHTTATLADLSIPTRANIADYAALRPRLDWRAVRKPRFGSTRPMSWGNGDWRRSRCMTPYRR